MVHREEHNQNFTIIDNVVLQNVNLSFEARGFMAYLLSFPNDWSFSIKGIVKHSGASESVVRRLLAELQAEGYVVINRHVDKSGRVTRWSWDLFETAKTPESTQMLKSPHVEQTTCGKDQMWSEPHVDRPDVVITTCGKSDTIQSTNNNKVLNKQSTKENKGQKRFVPPTVSEVKAYCQERNNGINPEEFIDYYASQGWKKANGRPVVDWKACVRTWEKDRHEAPKPQTIPHNSNPFTELKRREGYI